MKICYLADAGSIHVQKWGRYFVQGGHEVHIISFRNADIPGAKVHFLNNHGFISISPVASLLSRSGYILWTRKIKRLVNKINPDILHAHWATSYGLLAALTGFHPFMLSTWGSDILISPKRHRLMKKIVEFNLRKADAVTATSKMLSQATKKFIYDDKPVHIVPFGVDTKLFSPSEFTPRTNDLCIGVVKSLEEEYGIEYLIRAFKIVIVKGFDCKLLIVGSGSLKEKLISITKRLQLSKLVTFTGRINNDDVVNYLHKMDIFVMPSLSESFGVAVIEASSCEIPIIASDIGGLPEVLLNNETGFLVPPKEVEAIASKIISLIKNPSLRKKMGTQGRKLVESSYDFHRCGSLMQKQYNKILNKNLRSSRN